LVFIKQKVTKSIFKKKIPKPKPVQTGRFRFGSVFLGQKPVQTGLDRFFQFGSVFSVWLGFFPVFSGLGSVRFGYVFLVLGL
jgi:hypothetical protein